MPAAVSRLPAAALALLVFGCGGPASSTAPGLEAAHAPGQATTTAPRTFPSQGARPATGLAAPPAGTTDVTRDAARQYDDSHPAPTITSARRVDYRDPLAVARGYVAARNTFRYDDPPGYLAALSAPAFTTPAFAARSRRSPSAAARIALAQETSTVRVDAAQLEDEAPNSATTRYVNVRCTTTTTYRGAGSGRAEPAVWTLRLVKTRRNGWRVDGVLSTG